MLFLIAALLAADPAAAAVAATPASAPTSALDEAQANYERVEALYSQSCADRSYGAYDDLCDQLKTQMHNYRVELDRAEHAAAEKPAKAQAPK
jgi:hypothetical protein